MFYFVVSFCFKLIFVITLEHKVHRIYLAIADEISNIMFNFNCLETNCKAVNIFFNEVKDIRVLD